jgi:hypothetical protein
MEEAPREALLFWTKGFAVGVAAWTFSPAGCAWAGAGPDWPWKAAAAGWLVSRSISL